MDWLYLLARRFIYASSNSNEDVKKKKKMQEKLEQIIMFKEDTFNNQNLLEVGVTIYKSKLK